MRETSAYALQTGRTLWRNLTLTAAGRAAVKAEDDRLDRIAAAKRLLLLSEVRAALLGRVFVV